MDLWQLNIFCKVVELKSFSLAGKTVYLSQPTVSSHIKDLEEHFSHVFSGLRKTTIQKFGLIQKISLKSSGLRMISLPRQDLSTLLSS